MKKDYQSRFIELLSPDSKNFMNTGLTLQEFMQLNMAEKVAQAWFQQDRDEKARRFDFVVSLSIQFDRIRNETQFSLELAKIALEAVIEGDWKSVKEWADHFSFKEEGTEIQHRFEYIFRRFRELLQQAYDTRPGTMDAKA